MNVTKLFSPKAKALEDPPKVKIADDAKADKAKDKDDEKDSEKHQRQWFRSLWWLVTIADLRELEVRIMSVISDFVAKQAAFNARQGAAVDSIVVSVAGVSADIDLLNEKITELQNNPGPITPEDQALLDELVAGGDALAAKAEAVSTALASLDALTPPKPPVTE